LNGNVVVTDTQDDVIRVTTLKDEVSEQMERMQSELEKVNRERADFELIATRRKQEKQKVCPFPIS